MEGKRVGGVNALHFACTMISRNVWRIVKCLVLGRGEVPVITAAVGGDCFLILLVCR